MIIVSSFVAFVIINIAECQDVIHPLRRLSEKSPEEIIKKSRCFFKNLGTFLEKLRDFFLEAIPLTP